MKKYGTVKSARKVKNPHFFITYSENVIDTAQDVEGENAVTDGG